MKSLQSDLCANIGAAVGLGGGRNLDDPPAEIEPVQRLGQRWESASRLLDSQREFLR
jgi:hypothetical protein